MVTAITLFNCHKNYEEICDKRYKLLGFNNHLLELFFLFNH